MGNNRKLYKVFQGIVLLGLVFGCSSSNYKEVVVSSSNSDNQKPEWANIEKSVYEKDGLIMAVGLAEGKAEASVASLMRVSDHNARAEIFRLIENEIGIIFETAEENADGGRDIFRYFGSEMAKGIVQDLRIESRYYQKIARNMGEKNIDSKFVTEVYSLASIKSSVLKELIRKTAEKRDGMTPEFKQKLLEHINNKIDGI